MATPNYALFSMWYYRDVLDYIHYVNVHLYRFSLLLLDPGEIYFEDFSAYYYPEDVSSG